MHHFLEWLSGLLRLENISAIIGSLKRRVFKLNFLEMRITLDDEATPSPPLDGMTIGGYSEHLEKECIKLLNSVGNLGLWNQSRFQREILPSIEDVKRDIFIIYNNASVVGFAVLHKKSLNNDLTEIGYIAVKPESRGKKLGYKLLMYILAEAKRRNIAQVYLRTDSFRIPAIKTYLKCGFHPYIKDENEKRRWQKVMKKLKVNTVNGGEYKIIQLI